MKYLIAAISALLFISCSPGTKNNNSSESNTKTLGSVERLDDSINDLIAQDSKIEILAEGFTWAEGPVWVPSLNAVLYTDVPENTIYKFVPGEGNSVYLKPSGYTGIAPSSRESGANGLILDPEGNLLMCQHGDRRIAKLASPLDQPASSFITLANNYEGKRFSSPNDLIMSSNGDIYFTDPPYGLAGQDADSLKELSFNGVYKLDTAGNVTVLTKELTRPNGLALSPDEKTLYVANSDPKRAIWMAYDITPEGVANGRLFFDATDMIGDNRKGLPDGLKVHSSGTIFATGPGGVLVFSPTGKQLGTILTELATANCAFNADESILYMTTDDYLTQIKLK